MNHEEFDKWLGTCPVKHHRLSWDSQPGQEFVELHFDLAPEEEVLETASYTVNFTLGERYVATSEQDAIDQAMKDLAERSGMQLLGHIVFLHK